MWFYITFLVCQNSLDLNATVESMSAEKNETEVLAQWLQLESNLEEFLRKQSTNLLRDALPKIEGLDIGVSCIAGLMKLRRNVNNLDVEAMKSELFYFLSLYFPQWPF